MSNDKNIRNEHPLYVSFSTTGSLCLHFLPGFFYPHRVNFSQRLLQTNYDCSFSLFFTVFISNCVVTRLRLCSRVCAFLPRFLFIRLLIPPSPHFTKKMKPFSIGNQQIERRGEQPDPSPLQNSEYAVSRNHRAVQKRRIIRDRRAQNFYKRKI